MASRLATRVFGAARPALRPAFPARQLAPALAPLVSQRHQSNVPQQDPKTQAQGIIDALPGSSLASKTAILSGTAGLSIAAISNEIYVVNEESIILLSLLTVFWGVYHYLGPSYASWADNTADKIRGILQTARQDHKNAVQSRIDSVKPIGEVVDVTKNLFTVSKETAQLEAQAYELEQRTAMVAEAKAVLDSWVRYEGHRKARQQRELAESIIAKVEKELENPKVLKQILDQSVADVERIVSKKTT